MKGLTDVPGVLVGHASNVDAHTGCTAILCPSGAVGGVDIRGSATGSTELDLLSPLHLTTEIHGVCFAGGSAFGLEAASGVRRWLAAKNIGFQTMHGKVPLVPGAILYDLGVATPGIHPDVAMGHAAAANASTATVAEGCVGAGTGASVGKALGQTQAMKSGIGSASIHFASGVVVGALAAVNAYGDVVHPVTGTIVAGTRTSRDGREFADAVAVLRKQAGIPKPFGNTTLVVVATNARLSKPQATKLAQLAQQGLVRAIRPVHTVFDGDLTIALSTGTETADFTQLGIGAADVVAESILRAVTSAWSAAGLPGLAPAPASLVK